jgi:hypothetical protein
MICRIWQIAIKSVPASTFFQREMRQSRRTTLVFLSRQFAVGIDPEHGISPGRLGETSSLKVRDAF